MIIIISGTLIIIIAFANMDSFAWRVAPTAPQVDKMRGSSEKPINFLGLQRVKPRPSRYNGTLVKKLVVFLKKVQLFRIELSRSKEK